MMLIPLLVSFQMKLFTLATPSADIGSGFNNLASTLATYLGGVLAFVLVIEGYLYMSAVDDAQKAMHAKRAIGAAVAGAILVAVAVSLAPTIVKSIKQ